MEATRRLEFTPSRLLRTQAEYRRAVAEVDALLDASDTAGRRDRLAFVSLLVQEYEDRHDPVERHSTNPQEVVDFMLEQHGMRRADLATIMGGKSRVSEFFAGRRRLSIEQIRALRDALAIPADLLLQ